MNHKNKNEDRTIEPKVKCRPYTNLAPKFLFLRLYGKRLLLKVKNFKIDIRGCYNLAMKIQECK